MALLRHHLMRPAIILVAALLAIAVSRTDRLSDMVETGTVSSLLSIGIGLTVAAVVLSRVSARR
jgi:hypothetical protein